MLHRTQPTCACFGYALGVLAAFLDSAAPRACLRPTEPTKVGGGGGDGGEEETVAVRYPDSVAVEDMSVMAMVVMAVEASCEGRRDPVHDNIKVSGRRSGCSEISTRFHRMVRTRFTFFREDGVSKVRKPTRGRRTPVREDGFQHVSTLASARRRLAARTSAARRKSSAASPIAPPRPPTGRRSRRSSASTLQRHQLLLRHRRERLHRRESLLRPRESILRPRERDLGRRERILF